MKAFSVGQPQSGQQEELQKADPDHPLSSLNNLRLRDSLDSPSEDRQCGLTRETCTFNSCPSAPTGAGKSRQVDYLSLIITHGHPQGITGSETEQV